MDALLEYGSSSEDDESAPAKVALPAVPPVAAARADASSVAANAVATKKRAAAVALPDPGMLFADDGAAPSGGNRGGRGASSRPIAKRHKVASQGDGAATRTKGSFLVPSSVSVRRVAVSTEDLESFGMKAARTTT
jgi:hypothetical protein